MRVSPTRRGAILSIGVGVLVGVMLVFPSFLVGQAATTHWTCRPGTQVGALANYPIPAVLVNSPYGGRAWGNGTIPASFPGAWNGAPPNKTWVFFGTGALNGEALAAYFTVNVTFVTLSNVTAPGPGQASPCTQRIAVVLDSPDNYALLGGYILGPNNTTDISEPVIAGLPRGASNLTFNNSFYAANSASITTCGEPARWLPLVQSQGLNVSFPLNYDGQSFSVPYTIPVAESYHYWVPANFGTWEVDNLSAPHGPSGGWAFSYSPCT